MINVKFQNVKCKLIKAKNVHWFWISFITLVGEVFWLAPSDARLKTLVGILFSVPISADLAATEV